jgi:putative ABC transport system permease protein
MFRSFFLITLRILWGNKVPSLINILSLSIGMAAHILIMKYVYFEMSYDKFHENAKNIYRVTLKDGESFFATNYPATGPALKANFPEVREYARVLPQSMFNRETSPWSVIDGNGRIQAINVENAFNVDPSLLTMFSFPFVFEIPKLLFLTTIPLSFQNR